MLRVLWVRSLTHVDGPAPIYEILLASDNVLLLSLPALAGCVGLPGGPRSVRHIPAPPFFLFEYASQLQAP